MEAHATIILICGVILAVLIAGCTTQPATTPTPSPTTPVPTTIPPVPPITGKWTLLSALAGQGTTSVIQGTTITATFSEAGTVSGSAGCNNYMTTYQVQTNRLTIGKPEISHVTCTSPTGIMDQETIYLSNLQGAASYSVNGEMLMIYDQAGKTLLTYQKA